MKTVIKLVVEGVLFLGALFYVQQVHKEMQTMQQDLIQVKEEKNQLTQNETQLGQALTSEKQAHEALQKQYEELKQQHINTEGSKERQAFDTRIQIFFEKMYTFTPDTYGQRKKEVQSFLSDTLYQEYFPEAAFIGDSNGISSDLLSCDVYVKAWSTKQIEGLVVVRYSSGSAYGEQKAMNVFALTYDPQNEWIEKMDNLGSGYTSDLLE
ncbi:hypothetical protein NG891_17035 [Enterococcus gallinarum]|uniref:hypothetical protein n=1 Tax=Enterococcus gallinarum TaxID=1353 RepID=UPI00209012F6|nr:hypothetical protein [Enterococcus gallinarum]MCO5478437.1 hypothetical protein [Enterococcus gallinarum]